jgi:superfamily II DNA/RNA helicase
VNQLERTLLKIGITVKAFHSDLDQVEREQIMREFKSKKVSTLIGTDILSRGIDVEGISLILNYDVPPDPEDYIHRIGRTARAESKGTAITFINEKDQFRFKSIEDMMGRIVDKLPLPEKLGAGPEYNPTSRKDRGNGKRRFQPRGQGRAKSRFRR